MKIVLFSILFEHLLEKNKIYKHDIMLNGIIFFEVKCPLIFCRKQYIPLFIISKKKHLKDT